MGILSKKLKEKETKVSTVLPEGTTWDSPEGIALMEKIKTELTPREASVLREYKEKYPSTSVGCYGYAFNYAKKTLKVK